MTAERKIVFAPSDVERLEFVCKACGAILALDPSKENHFIRRECPNCGEGWMLPDSQLHLASVNLLRSIRTLAATAPGLPGFVEARFQVRLSLRSDEPK
jgi:ribosomal protein S27AE